MLASRHGVPMDESKLRELVWEPGVKAIVERLGDREVRVLYFLCCRLHQGQREFGKLKPKKRRWVKELVEENADNALYSMFHLVDMADEDDGRDNP